LEFNVHFQHKYGYIRVETEQQPRQSSQGKRTMSEHIQAITFHRIKLMCSGHELAMIQHQPAYLLVNVRARRAVFRAQLCQLHWLLLLLL